jgi:predicted nicotinamide N-methyase
MAGMAVFLVAVCSTGWAHLSYDHGAGGLSTFGLFLLNSSTESSRQHYLCSTTMPRGPRKRPPPQERSAYGLTILQPSHPEVRRLQQDAARPTLHGHKVWPTSFVLLDYLHQRGLPPQTRVLELGCGWGLVGIACATLFQAQVTGLDADAAVFPYLHLHAQRHSVQITTWHATFADLTPQALAAFDLIVGADICFWDDLVDPLYQLIRHGVAAGSRRCSWRIPAVRPLTSSALGVSSRAPRRY